MNKIFFSAAILLFAIPSVYAGPVTKDKAQRKAEAFFASRPDTRASGHSIKLAWSLHDSGSKPDLLYAFNDEYSGSFVIVSGEDAATPVLGYSSSGLFPDQDMPEAMRSLLEYYGAVISMARERKWSAAASDNSFNPEHAVRLETARWSQGDPYNRYCPVIDGKRCVTGCVATAIGIIMNYHRWPEYGKGNLPSYSYTYNGKTIDIDGISLGHRYDWTAINEGSDYDQVARLLHEIGVMTHMRYSPSESSGMIRCVRYLSDYYGYDKDILNYSRSSCMDAQWEFYIRNEIDSGRPVFFSGNPSNKVGHAMVIDGYCGRYFSINFGWGDIRVTSTDMHHPNYSDPNQDGLWFTLTPVEGHEEDLVYFNTNQDIFCNIKPDEGGKPDVTSTISMRGNLGLPYDFALGKEFFLKLQSDRDVRCEYALIDCNGNIKERISAPFTATFNSPQSVPCVIKEQPEEGDWIAPVFMVNGETIIPRHNRFSEFRFKTGSPLKEVQVGFMTQDTDWDLENGLLARYVRSGGPSFLTDCLYFRCYKDFTWELLKRDGDSTTKEWSSDDYSLFNVSGHNHDTTVVDSWPVMKYRCMSLFQEDICYHLIPLDRGDYILRIKNPLTGESVTINLTI